MIPDKYVWLVWSSAFLLPWLAAYALFPKQRSLMLAASVLTMPLGLTEPLFIPAYWNPPSLFDLAQNTGFDIESLIFSFAIGGIGATLYNLITQREAAELPFAERAKPRHRLHALALMVPFISFPLLYLLPWNPIYPAIVAMTLGALAALLCRPDLAGKICLGGILFVAFYTLFLLGMEWSAPGYVERVWNLPALSGLRIARLPIEELLFAVAFGAYWSSAYEHFTWRRLIVAAPPAGVRWNRGRGQSR